MTKKNKSVLSRFFSWCGDYFKVILKALGKIGSDNVSILASGMVYSTLVAIVPCVTFLSAFLTSLGGLESFSTVVGEWLIDTFGEKEGTFVLEKVTLFSKNAMSLGIMGLITFVITGSLLASHIDSVINNIFHTRQSHGVVKRYVKILIFIIVLSVFIAVSLSLSESIREDVYAKIGVSVSIGAVRMLLKKAIQILLIFIVLFFLMCFVPNTKIKVSSAVAGAMLGTILMRAFYFIFTKLIISTVKYSVIYGSLASILLVLLFFYIMWYIIIFVSEVTFIHQFRPEKDEDESHILTPQREIEEGLRVLLVIAKSFERGEGGISSVIISSRAGVIYFRTLTYLKLLEQNGFIKELASSSYILSRPVDKMDLDNIVDCLFSSDSKSSEEALERFKQFGLESLKGKILEDLIKDKK